MQFTYLTSVPRDLHCRSLAQVILSTHEPYAPIPVIARLNAYPLEHESCALGLLVSTAKDC